MSTTIRPEISEKNRYWIERHRYYELKHFCLQYPMWKRGYLSLDGLSKNLLDQAYHTDIGQHSDPTSKCAIDRSFYLERMEMVEKTAEDADGELSSYILKGVTEGVSYTYLKARLDIPCCRDTYYRLYRRFFWLLDKERQ